MQCSAGYPVVDVNVWSQVNLPKNDKLTNVVYTQLILQKVATLGPAGGWMIEELPAFGLFSSVMSRGTHWAGSPLRVCWWAGTLWWLLMSEERHEPLGWELAGCRVCPDGVSSGPYPPPPQTSSLHTMGQTSNIFSISNNTQIKMRAVWHQKYFWLAGISERDPSLTFRVCLMARDGKVRF